MPEPDDVTEPETETETEIEAEQPSFGDAFASVRKLATTDAADVSHPPDGYSPLTVDLKRRLRKLSRKDTAEAQAAAKQIIDNEATYQEDLGEDAPTLDKIKYLAPMFEGNAQTVFRLEALLQFHQDKQQVLASDLITLLEETNTELEHRMRKRPHLADRYQALRKLFQMRRKAIADGIARTRKPDPDAST